MIPGIVWMPSVTKPEVLLSVTVTDEVLISADEGASWHSISVLKDWKRKLRVLAEEPSCPFRQELLAAAEGDR